MEIEAKKIVKVNATTLKLHMKVRDQFEAILCDQDGDEIKQYEGYVPDFMPGEHYGDYLILDIDIDTGQIKNWKQPSKEQVEALIRSNED